MMTPLARWTVAAATAVFAATAAPAEASFLQELGSPFPVGAQPYGVLTADFNRDGRPDVVGINGTGSTVTTILRRPTGGFAIEGSTPAVGGDNFGAVADFNRDGWPDVAVTGYKGDGGVAVLLRNPVGGFVKVDASTNKALNWLGAVAAADFNADGRMDLAVARYEGNGLTILLQQVDGKYVEEANPPATGSKPRFIAVADFNADTRPDLAVTNIGSGTVTILLRKASGAGFDQEVGSPHKVGLSPTAIVAADLDGDGRPDLATSNINSDTVSVLIRQSAGGFAAAASVPVGDGPYGVVSADFNRDGLVDLATANHESDDVSVLIRQPGGGYAPEAGSPYPAGDGANQIASADFNGDAKPDLAISNDASNNVTVLLNTTPDPVQPQVQPPAANPAPGPGPTAPVPTAAPSINARLVLTWTITKANVKLTSATLRDLPAGGATVKITCKTCKINQTVTAKKATLTLSKLRNRKLRRGASFTVTVSKPGYSGLTFTRKVKSYGRTKAALRKAVKAPFSETRTCVPAAAGAKRC